MGTLTGIHISHYKILERLRFDPAFAVYNAMNLESQEMVQFWAVFPEERTSESFRRAFLDRMQLLSLLEHPSLPQIKDFGRESDLLFWITPPLDGSLLAASLAEPHEPHYAASIAAQVADALDYLHQQGMLHGCLSPETIQISEDGATAWLLLYGLADLMNTEINKHVPEGLVGFGLGQPGFLSPEQIGRRELTQLSDVYALGGILYAMLTGQPPFAVGTAGTASTPVETTFRQMTADLEWPKKQRGHSPVPDTAVRLVHKCLARDPNERLQNAAEARRVLEHVMAGKGARVRVSRALLKGAPQPAYLPWLRLGLALAVLALAGGIAAWKLGIKLEALLPAPAAAPTALADVQATRAATQDPVIATALASKSKQDATKVASENAPTATEVKDPLMATIYAASTANAAAGTPEAKEATSTPEAPQADQPTPTPAAAEPAAPAGPGSGPVLIGTRTPGEAQVIIPANLEQVREIARLGFGRFNHAAWSPDEKNLAIATSAGVFVLDATSLVAFLDPQDEATAVQFSLDGARLAVGVKGGDIQLWDWKVRTKAMTLKGHTKQVSRLLFSPNRRQLFSASYDLYIRVWDVTSGQQVRSIPAHAQPVKDMALTADGREMITGAGDQKVKIWDIATGKMIDEYQAPNEVLAVAMTEDGRIVAAGGKGCLIYQWNRDTRQLRSNPFFTRAWVWSLKFMGPDRLIVGLQDGQLRDISAKYDPNVNAYNSECPNPVTKDISDRLGAGFELSSYVAVGKTGATATLNWDGNLRISGTSAITIPTKYENFTRLAFSPNSQRLLAGGKLDKAFLWSTSDNLLLGMMPSVQVPLGMPFSDSSDKIAMVSKVNIPSQVRGDPGIWVFQVRTFSSTNLSIEKSLTQHPEDFWFQFTHNDTLLLGGDAMHAQSWDMSTGLETFINPANEHGCEVSRSKNNREILSVYSPIGLMREWDENTQRICSVSTRFGDALAAFSADRKFLVTANPDTKGRLEMLDVGQNKDAWKSMPEHKVTALAFSPDDALLVTGADDGALTFWDVATGKALRTIEKAHFAQIWTIAFSPDGKRVASAGIDGTVRIWEANNGGVNP